jgi:uncharacterized protein (TIGR00106 family)
MQTARKEVIMLAEFSIFPLDQGGTGLSRFVAESIKIVENSGLEYSVHAMGTLIEGPAERVFDVIRTCHQNMASQCDRVITTVRIDDRKGALGSMVKKVESVEKKLGHEIRKGLAPSRGEM